METKWLNCTFWEKENLDKTLEALKVIHNIHDYEISTWFPSTHGPECELSIEVDKDIIIPEFFEI
jgi:hypothetical protein